MQLDQSKNMKLDDRIESYSPFFDHDWAREVNEIAERAKKLDVFVFDLMLAIKGISRTAALPLFAVDVAQSYSSGHQMESLENSLTLKLVNHIAERISQRIVLAGAEPSELRKVMLDLSEEFLNKSKGISVEFPRQELWDGMVKIIPGETDTPKNEFRIALWSCQRICYSGLFFAYEDFVVRCVHTQSGLNTWASDKQFNQLCRDTLGDVLAQSCWLDSRIVSAKRIRHSVAHVGGRETKDLKGTNHGIDVVDGMLQILPADVHDLFELLKPRIKSLVDWAAPLPAFS